MEQVEVDRLKERVLRLEPLRGEGAAVPCLETPPSGPQPYGDLVSLNPGGPLLSAVGRDGLEEAARDHMDLLQSSSAVFETNGDYAMGIFTSGWCRFLDNASRKLAPTADNREALRSGQWHCHESCWTEASRVSIEKGCPVDVECRGGIRLYSIPIMADGEIAGSINFGYGNPPESEERLREIAETYQVSVDDLREQAAAHPRRAPWVVELAKRRLHTTARLLGETVARRRVQDRLEAKEAEAREVSDRLNAALESTNDSIFSVDGDWRFVYLNGNARRQISGGRQLLGQSLWDAFPGALGTQFEHEYMRAMRDRVPVAFTEYYAPLKAWFQASGYPSEGGLTVYFRDVTENRKAETALRESEERYRVLVEALPQLVWSAKPDGCCDYFSRRWVEYTGMSESEHYDDGWLTSLHPEDRERAAAAWDAAHQLPGVYDLEHRLRAADGSYRWFKTRGLPLRDADGRVLRWFGACTDIDEEKRTEEALRTALADLNLFAHSASHDLKEPLRMIAIYSQMLERRLAEALDDESREYFGYVIGGARRMEELIGGLLSYTEIAQGSDGGPVATVNSNAVVDLVLAGLRPTLSETGASVTVGPLPPLAVREAHFFLVMQHLLSNALEYRDQRVPRIQIAAESESEEGFARFSVKDNGIGIAPEYKDRIFGLFKRLHPRTSYSGSGIGLAICQRVVERYGGRIWVESTLGEGSTFLFTMPAA